MTVEDLVQQAKTTVPKITCQDYLALRNRQTPHVLIDVREATEWAAGHIEGALHVPRGLLEFKIAELVPDKNTLIVTQCASGGRSALGAQTLLRMGYTNVYNLEGGYQAYCQLSQT